MFKQPVSIKELITQSSQLLNKISDSQKLDCQILLSHVLKKPMSYLMTWPEKLIDDDTLYEFEQLFSQRLAGQPIAYIIGEREFWSLPLKVSPATLIPRPDTEVLVELVLAKHPQKHLQCLDLGTGTGAIALALSSEMPSWQIDAVDFNEQAVELAQLNKANCHLTNVNVYQSDWFSQIPAKGFDVIVSNPPYIDKTDPHLVEGDVRFEPLTALVADDEGLRDIRHIIETSRAYLNPQGGSVYIEHGYQQAEQVQALFIEYGFDNISTQKDFGANPRITYASFSIKK